MDDLISNKFEIKPIIYDSCLSEITKALNVERFLSKEVIQKEEIKVHKKIPEPIKSQGI